MEGKQEMKKKANLQPLLFIEVHVHVARNLRHCMIKFFHMINTHITQIHTETVFP